MTDYLEQNKSNILYLECYSGISGDMTVAALLDLCGYEKDLLEGLNSLNIDGYDIEISQGEKCGIVGKNFNVILKDECSHHHDGHAHQHHGHHHKHRNLKDIETIIESSSITENAKNLAIKIFKIVAKAEGKVHGEPIDQVHFHEVGAVDSIIDIVATSILIDKLKIKEVIISPISEGTGHVKCQHGIIPVPAPATLEIASQHNLCLKITDNKGEMVTPTGAAIAAALKTRDNLPSEYRIKKVGIGVGKKDFPRANVLRAMLIEEEIDDNKDSVILLECNIDDMTGEELGFALEILLEKGALDAYFTPIYMKKNRPAYMLSVIVAPNKEREIKELIFKHTTTLGIRCININRDIMKRDIITFKSSLGPVSVKKSSYGSVSKYSLEYEEVKKIAKNNEEAISKIYKKIYRELPSE